MTAYSELSAHFGRIAALSNAVGILQWDSDTMMPKGAAGTRAESMALLHVLRHGMITEPRIGDWLAAGRGGWRSRRLGARQSARDPAALDGRDRACRPIWSRPRARRSRPARCAGAQARAEADFAGLLPYLAEVLNLQREIGRAKGEKLGLSRL